MNKQISEQNPIVLFLCIKKLKNNRPYLKKLKKLKLKATKLNKYFKKQKNATIDNTVNIYLFP